MANPGRGKCIHVKPNSWFRSCAWENHEQFIWKKQIQGKKHTSDPFKFRHLRPLSSWDILIWSLIWLRLKKKLLNLQNSWKFRKFTTWNPVVNIPGFDRFWRFSSFFSQRRENRQSEPNQASNWDISGTKRTYKVGFLPRTRVLMFVHAKNISFPLVFFRHTGPFRFAWIHLRPTECKWIIIPRIHSLMEGTGHFT